MTTSRTQSNVSRLSDKTNILKPHAKTNISNHKEAAKYDWDNKWLKGSFLLNLAIV